MSVAIMFMGLVFAICAWLLFDRYKQSIGGCYLCNIDGRDVILVLDWDKHKEKYCIYNSKTLVNVISGSKNVCESYLSAIGAVKVNKK